MIFKLMMRPQAHSCRRLPAEPDPPRPLPRRRKFLPPGLVGLTLIRSAGFVLRSFSFAQLQPAPEAAAAAAAQQPALAARRPRPRPGARLPRLPSLMLLLLAAATGGGLSHYYSSRA